MVCFSATLFAIVLVGGNVRLSLVRHVCVFCRVILASCQHHAYARVVAWPSSRGVGDLLMFCVAFICREARQMVPDAVRANVRKKPKKSKNKSGRVW